MPISFLVYFLPNAPHDWASISGLSKNMSARNLLQINVAYDKRIQKTREGFNKETRQVMAVLYISDTVFCYITLVLFYKKIHHIVLPQG